MSLVGWKRMSNRLASRPWQEIKRVSVAENEDHVLRPKYGFLHREAKIYISCMSGCPEMNE